MMACRLRVARMRQLFKVAIAAPAKLPRSLNTYRALKRMNFSTYC